MANLLRRLNKKLKSIPGGFGAALGLSKGIFYCEDCLRKEVEKKTPDKDAYRKAISSGMFKKVEDGDCVFCHNKASYNVSLTNAVKSIKQTQHE